MRVRFVHRAAFAILFICQLSICLGTEIPNTNESSKYLNAVREFGDNVLKYGRDTYGPKHTPLFVDGLNIRTHEPVKWIAPNGDRWILSNLASQQNLFRTLDGLTKITGDPKYRQAAAEAIEYAFANLRSPNGLLYWGGHAAYDAWGDKPSRHEKFLHEFKSHYPYYELMWQVNPITTKKLIGACWSAHILDWSNLDMSRHAQFYNSLGEPWNHEYKEGAALLPRKGDCNLATASDLFYAAVVLSRLSGDKAPLIWAKRLAHLYIGTRHPKTGIGFMTYNPSWLLRPHQLIDDFKEHFLDGQTKLFPHNPFPSPYQHWPGKPFVHPWICQFIFGEMLGPEGEEFTQSALEEFTAWGKVAYRNEDNSFVPMLTDGTSLEGYVCKKDGSFGPKGTVSKACPADPLFFWAYCVAYRVTGDDFMWKMARDIARANDFGDIGVAAKNQSQLQAGTSCSDPYSLLGFLELHKRTRRRAFLEMAKKIGDNILTNRFLKGLFVSTKRYIYARFDSLEPLALLHLDTAMCANEAIVPLVWPSMSYFECAYGLRECEADIYLIYTLTDSAEPHRLLQEAAASGNIDEVKSLISKGADINAREYGFQKTALHRAAIGGHKNVTEFLLAKGADINAGCGGATSALHYAAEQGHKEIADLLIAKGADVNAKNASSDTPLHYAARHRGVGKDIIELLIAKGANVNAKNNDGQAPLDIAVRQNHRDIIELLIEKGADVNTKDNWDWTPLHSAVYGHKDIVELLIAKGADINARDGDGRTPLWYAQDEGHTEIVELLRKHGAKE